MSIRTDNPTATACQPAPPRRPASDSASKAAPPASYPTARAQQASRPGGDTPYSSAGQTGEHPCPPDDGCKADRASLAEVLDVDPHALYGKANDTLEPDEERLPLESILQKAAESSKRGEAGAAHNSLIGMNSAKLYGIVSQLSLMAKASGPHGKNGLVHPGVTMTRDVKAGHYDDMPMDDYNAVLACVNDLSTLWEGKHVMEGLPLACNALLRVVFSDPDVFELASHRVEEWLGTTWQVLNDRGALPK